MKNTGTKPDTPYFGDFAYIPAIYRLCTGIRSAECTIYDAPLTLNHLYTGLKSATGVTL